MSSDKNCIQQITESPGEYYQSQPLSLSGDSDYLCRLNMVKMRLILLFLLLSAFAPLASQTIRVLDRSDMQPVELVMVYNKNQKITAFTNRNGDVQFTGLQLSDSLIFQHATYQESTLTYAQIKRNRNQVLLAMRLYDLEQFTISASRWEQKREDVPARFSSIGAREVAFQNPQTAADLLARTNEVFVQKSQLGGGSPMLRGFSANSVLLVVDGVRMNNAIYRGGNLHNVISLDPNLIENTEVIFGPGSVIYGSDAMGGVMTFNTLQPRLAISDTVAFAVRSMIRYSSANHEKTAGVVVKAAWKKWASATSFTFSDFDDLRTGSKRSSKFPDQGKRIEYVHFTGIGDTIITNENPDVLKPSGYNQWNFAQKIRFKPGKNIDLNYSFHYSESSDIPRYDRLIEYRQGKLRFAEWYYGPQRWVMQHFQARLYEPNRFFSNAKISFAYQMNEESRHDRRFGQALRTGRTEKVHAWILNADFEKSFSPSLDLYYGLEGFYNFVISKAKTINIFNGVSASASTRYPDGDNDYRSLAAYTFARKSIKPRLILNAGIRYSRVVLQSYLIDTLFFNFPFKEIELRTGAWNGSAGLAMHPHKTLQVNLNFSTGFRAPNLDDAGKIFESEPGNVVVPNPDLKPEYALNAELGLVYKPVPALRLEFNAFYTRLFDVMVRRDFQYLGSDSIVYNGELSKVQAMVNAGKGEIAGWFVGFRYGIVKNLNAGGSITYTYGMETTTQPAVPLNHIPPMFGTAFVNFTPGRLRIEASIIFNAAKKWDDLDPSEQAKTAIYTEDGSLAWFTLNLKASYQLFNYLQINAGIENILDRHYWPYASGIPAPGRNIFLAIRGNFRK